MEYTEKHLKLLIEGKLSSDMLHEVQVSAKDENRLEKIIKIEQGRVPWKEQIILPLQEHLYIVKKGTEKIIKCSCGFEFGDYKNNWKDNALVYQRDTDESLQEVHKNARRADPKQNVIREFYCAGCGTQLDVEAVPPGYPFIFSALPDLED